MGSVTDCAKNNGCTFTNTQTINGVNVTKYNAAVKIDTAAKIGARAKIECGGSTVKPGSCGPASAKDWADFGEGGAACDTAYVALTGEVNTPFTATVLTAGEVGFDAVAKAKVTDTTTVPYCGPSTESGCGCSEGGAEKPV